jgi:HAD superfamily hydrolase (TIGR01509 family)
VTRTSGPAPLEALTCDLWYTQIYLTPSDRRRLEVRRWNAWRDESVRAGLAEEAVDAFIGRLAGWIDDEERAGRSPSIPEQARWASRQIGRPLDEGRIATGLSAAFDGVPVRVAPGARSALTELRREGVRLGVVSNILHEPHERVARLMRRLGLWSLFDGVVFSSALGWAKPRPEPFRACLRELGARPEVAAHIGDLPSDVLGAQRAGLQPLLFTGLGRWRPRSLGAPPPSAFPRVPRVDRWRALRRTLTRLRRLPAPSSRRPASH